MSLTETVVEGVVRPDGSLVLDEPTRLPAGRVQVVVRQEDWWTYLQRCRRELEQTGAGFRSGAEIEFEVDQIRGEAERVDGLCWEQEWARHHAEPPTC